MTDLKDWRFAWLPGDAVGDQPMNEGIEETFEHEDSFPQSQSSLHTIIQDDEDPKEEDSDELGDRWYSSVTACVKGVQENGTTQLLFEQFLQISVESLGPMSMLLSFPLTHRMGDIF